MSGRSITAIALGSSTGGPAALIEVLRHLRGVGVPIFITQHVGPAFTEFLAQDLLRQSGVPCSEAIEGEIIRAGHAYLAPRDHDLTVQRFGGDVRVTLRPPAPAARFCPAIDPMLASLADAYGAGLCAAILTGMDGEGAAGVAAVKAAGGQVIVQDPDTSIARGMPAAVQTMADLTLPLTAIGPALWNLSAPIALAGAA